MAALRSAAAALAALNAVGLAQELAAVGGPAAPFPGDVPPASTVATTLKLSGPIATSSGPSFASFNFDWHCGAEDSKRWHCLAEPGWNHMSVNIGLDLTNPALIAAAKTLAPGRLRIGGSEGDFICYDVPSGSCFEKIAKGPKLQANSPAWVLNMSRWQQIVDFSDTTGVQLVFGLNGYSRGRGKMAPMDWTQNNTEAFVRYVAKTHPTKVFAFELGNEKCGMVDAKVYGEDVRYLRKLLDSLWKDDPKARPLVVAPDCNPVPGSWATEFMEAAGDAIDVLTYHFYAGFGLDNKLPQKMLAPNYGKSIPGGFLGAWEKYGRDQGVEIWAGEIAAAWHSGEPGVTDRFISSFWYADAMGTVSAQNATGFCRQTLVGGFYGLLDRDTLQPNPDFFIAQSFHDLMGSRVLGLTSSDKGLRTHAHCHPSLGGKATLLLVNQQPSSTFDVDLSTALDAAKGLDIYTFTAGDGSLEGWRGLDSRLIKLNGKLLDGPVAAPLPPPAQSTEKVLKVAPLSIVFVVGEGVSACGMSGAVAIMV